MLGSWYLIFTLFVVSSHGRRVGPQGTAISGTDGFSGPISRNILPMKRRNIDQSSSAYSRAIRRAPLSARQEQSATTPLTAVLGFEYVVEMEWSGQTFQVVVDTGSSDTYIAQQGFTCTDSAGNVTSVRISSTLLLHPVLTSILGRNLWFRIYLRRNIQRWRDIRSTAPILFPGWGVHQRLYRISRCNIGWADSKEYPGRAGQLCILAGRQCNKRTYGAGLPSPDPRVQRHDRRQA